MQIQEPGAKSQEQFTVPLWRLLVSEISRDDILLRASALAYSTLASLVPIFAIVLAVLSGPAFQESRDKVLDTLANALVPSEGSTAEWFVEDDSPQVKLKQTFQETITPLAEKLGTVSIFGFLMLVVIVGMLFRTVEGAFNVIWRANLKRPLYMRVAIGTGLIFWGPVMLALSISLTETLRSLPILGSYLLPAALTAAAFTGFYMLMPHARVQFTSALAGGTAAAACWELAKVLFLVYVTRVVGNYKLYGSLGLVPMLFLWVYVNWVVILSGAEVAYCLQHRRALEEQWLAQQCEKSAAQKL